MSDALMQMGTSHRGFQNARIMPNPADTIMWLHFSTP